MKPMRLSALFIRTAIIIFLVTGLAKLVSAAGSDKVLSLPEPAFGLVSNRLLLIISAIAELVLTLVLLSRINGATKAALVAWFSLIILGYRSVLWEQGFQGHCLCLGTLGGAVGLNPAVANWLMLTVAIYLLAGSLIFWRITTKSDQAGKLSAVVN